MTASPATPGVRVVGFPAGTGYGDLTTQTIAALHEVGRPVDFLPLVPGSTEWGPDESIAPLPPGRSLGADPSARFVRTGVPTDTVFVSVPPAWVDASLDEPDHRGKRRVVQLCWESDRLTPAAAASLERADLVLAPCRHNADVFRAAGVTTPVEVVAPVPRPVRPVAPAELPDLGGRFTFLVIGAWSARKGIEATIRAFLDTFTADDGVALVVKSGAIDHLAEARLAHLSREERPPHAAQAWLSLARILTRYPQPPPVHLVGEQLDQDGIDALHAAADCFVSLSLGEGWGLGAHDAARRGRPVLLTRWAGPADWLPVDWPLTIPHELVVAADQPLDLWTRPVAGERWARPDPAEARRLLRWVADNPAAAAELGASLADHLERTLPRPQAVDDLVAALDGT